MRNKKRVLKSEKILAAFVEPGNGFHVGILWEDYIKSAALKEYGLPSVFAEGKEVLPSAKGGATKVNQKGKYARKQPEQKTTKTVHIEFTNKHGTFVSYDRDFNVYVKELVNKYDMKFIFMTNEHGQQVVVSPVLTFTNEYDTNMMNTHAINLFLEVFGDYEVFDKDLNPAIPFNKRYTQDFLTPGTLTKSDGGRIEEITAVADRFLKDPTESKAFAQRLFTFVDFQPDLKGKGPLGFYGYIVFGFHNRGIVVLESMYKGYATYVFDEKDYEELVVKSKQEIFKGKLYKERFVHFDNWENRVRGYMESFGVVDGPNEPDEPEAPLALVA